MLLLITMLLLSALRGRICPRVHVPQISSMFAYLSMPLSDTILALNVPLVCCLLVCM